MPESKGEKIRIHTALYRLQSFYCKVSRYGQLVIRNTPKHYDESYKQPELERTKSAKPDLILHKSLLGILAVLGHKESEEFLTPGENIFTAYTSITGSLREDWIKVKTI